MNKKYVIQWKSKVNGRAGKGTKLFDREEADRYSVDLSRPADLQKYRACLAEHGISDLDRTRQ